MINAIDYKNACGGIYVFDGDESLSILPNVKRINILIGENNSGKSRFCRELISNNSMAILSDENVSSQDFERLKQEVRSVFIDVKRFVPSIEINPKHNDLSACELYIYYTREYLKIDAGNNFQIRVLKSNIDNCLSRLYQQLSTRKQVTGNATNFNTKVYIPILRGIECFNLYFDVRQDQQLDSVMMNKAQRNAMDDYKSNVGRIYKNKISKIYNIKEDLIFTGENLYIDIRDKLLGNESERKAVKDFEVFISENFYNGESFSIIPIIKKGYLDVKIGNGPERELHNLGDGIKQLICILYKIFEIRNEYSLVVLEEPELNLHPGYQRRLLEIFQEKQFSKLQFFITTHSNHLVDSSFEYDNISIYRFEKIDKNVDKFRIINSSPRDIKILDMLGVNNSSVFMANSTIWIEGLSDKIYLSKYLQIYMRAKKLPILYEGTDYSFVEYGGNNITHWTFDDESDADLINASGITNRAFIVVDNDNDKKKDRKNKLKKTFGNNYIELPVREIENTIKKEVLEKALFDGSPTYKKMNEDTGYYKKDVYLWEYIDKRYQLGRKYWNNRSKQPAVRKVTFAKTICDHITTIDDLTSEAIKLCERLYEFISSVSDCINS